MPVSTKKRTTKRSKTEESKLEIEAKLIEQELPEELDLADDTADSEEDDCNCTCTCSSCHHDSPPFNENLSDEDIEGLSLFFKALADPSRLKIVVALLRHGQLSVSEIAEQCNSTVSATSHQLAQLKMHRLVSGKRQGLRIYYKLCDYHISEGVKLAIEHIKE